jgi:uncharacterized OB-fold protein
MTNAWLADELVWIDDRGTSAGAEVRLNATHCPECGRFSIPATGTCEWCGAAGSDVAIAAEGEVVASTAVLHATPGAIVEVPYVVALLRFEDAKLDVLGRVLGTDDPDAIPPGTRLRVVADTLPDGRLHYAFG